jgi:ABC-2 type transport system permease protein
MSARQVIGALFYLRATSLRNALIARFARLKQPKYLVGAIVGVVYFYWLIFSRGVFGRARQTAGLDETLPLAQMSTVVAIAALLVTILAALYWLWPRSRAALTFSQAEIAFLFPAPIDRKTLIHFRWINAQLRILFTSLLLALFSGAWSFVPGNAAVRIFGWWLLLSTLDLHAVGSSFALTRLLDRGMTSLRRSALTIAIAAVAIGGALLGSWRGLRPPEPGTLADPSAVFDYIGSLLATEPLAWLLAPARWAVQPLLAHDWRAFVAALGPALALYALHYLWVLRSEVSFEEASVAKAEKVAARRTALLRDGNVRFGGERKARPPPFALAGKGRPEIAFLWKNLLASASYLQRPRVALVAVAVIVVGSFGIRMLDLPPLPVVVGFISIMCAGYTLVFGPMLARQDLRHDLPNADILKTYPLPGWQIVLGEVLAPITIVTVLVWLELLAAALNVQLPRGEALPAGMRASVALGLAVLVPFLTAIMLLVMNAAVLLFPAWVPQGAGRARGIDVMGQRLLFVAGLFLTMTAALLPAAIAAAALFFMTLWLIGPIAAGALGVLAALVALGTEIALVISWLGKLFERFDLSAELKP